MKLSYNCEAVALVFSLISEKPELIDKDRFDFIQPINNSIPFKLIQKNNINHVFLVKPLVQ